MLCKHGTSYSEARAFRYIKRFCDDDMRWFRIMFTFFFSAVTALGADCASIPVLSQGPNYDLRSAPVDGGCDWRPTFLFFSSLPPQKTAPTARPPRLHCCPARGDEMEGVAAHARASTRLSSSFPAHEALLALVSAGGTGRRANQTEPKKLRRPGFSLKEGAR